MLAMVRFLELSSILEPGRLPKTDKAAIMIDAVRMVTQLRGEAQKLKDSNTNLQEKIKELKVRPNFVFGVEFLVLVSVLLLLMPYSFLPHGSRRNHVNLLKCHFYKISELVEMPV